MSQQIRFTNRVKWGLAVFLFLLIYDGALRKWVFPGSQQTLFVMKDVLLFSILLYSVFIHRNKNSLIWPSAYICFLFYAIWTILEIANVNLPNMLVGIWGVKAHLFYASLILLIPLAFGNLDKLFSTLKNIYPWIVIPVCLLSFVQVASPASSFINQSLRGGNDAIAYFGSAGLVRVTGTFSYISGMGYFVQIFSILGLGLFLTGERARLFLIGFGFSITALPVTGSRSVILVVTLSAFIILISALISRQIGVRMMMRVAVIITVLFIISLQTQDAAWVAFQERVEGARYDQYRAITVFTNAFDFFDIAGFTGYGTGAANLGAVALVEGVTPFSWLPAGRGFEEESGRLVIELGIIGWFFSLLMRIAFLSWAVVILVKGRNHSIRTASILALPEMALGVYQGNGIFIPPIGACYYWFCVALLAMAEFENRQVSFYQRAAISQGKKMVGYR